MLRTPLNVESLGAHELTARSDRPVPDVSPKHGIDTSVVFTQSLLTLTRLILRSSSMIRLPYYIYLGSRQPLSIHVSTLWLEHRALVIGLIILSIIGSGTLFAGAYIITRRITLSRTRRLRKHRTMLRPLRLPIILKERTKTTDAQAYSGGSTTNSTILSAMIILSISVLATPIIHFERNRGDMVAEDHISSYSDGASVAHAGATEHIEPVKKEG